MKVFRAFAVPLLVAGFLTITPQVAHAVIDQVCAVNEVVTATPPVTNTPQTVTVTVEGKLFNCSSTANPTGSYIEVTTVPDTSCLNLLNPGPGTRTYVWGNPAFAPSQFTYNRTVTVGLAVVVVTFVGHIASGAYTPSPTKQESAAAVSDFAACSTTGVSTVTFYGTVSIGV